MRGILVIVLAALALAGCGAGRVTHIVGAPTPPDGFVDRDSPTTEPRVRDAVFLLALDKKGIPYKSESGIIDMAHFICDDLRTHPERTRREVGLLIARTSVYSPMEAGYITGAAVKIYCPEFDGR